MSGLSVNEMTTYRWSFEEDVTRYRDAGIAAIGVWRQKLADFGEDRALELLARSGLKVSNLLWAGGFTGSDGHSHQEGLADAREALQLAAALGTSHLIVYSGARNNHTQNHARRLFTSALADLLPLAEKLRIVLDIEPMHADCAEQWTFLTSLDDALALIDGLESPYLKLAFDTYHFGHQPGIAERLRAIAPKIGIVHLADGKGPPDCDQNRHCLGDGDVPLACIIKALRQGGYDGYFDVELIGEAIENCDYRQLLQGSKSAFDRWIVA